MTQAAAMRYGEPCALVFEHEEFEAGSLFVRRMTCFHHLVLAGASIFESNEPVQLPVFLLVQPLQFTMDGVGPIRQLRSSQES